VRIVIDNAPTVENGFFVESEQGSANLGAKALLMPFPRDGCAMKTGPFLFPAVRRILPYWN
jgi:hypothetical protein